LRSVLRGDLFAILSFDRGDPVLRLAVDDFYVAEKLSLERKRLCGKCTPLIQPLVLVFPALCRIVCGSAGRQVLLCLERDVPLVDVELGSLQVDFFLQNLGFLFFRLYFYDVVRIRRRVNFELVGFLGLILRFQVALGDDRFAINLMCSFIFGASSLCA
jgi:hypothetical protein